MNMFVIETVFNAMTPPPSKKF